jgi:hypothetical protein
MIGANWTHDRTYRWRRPEAQKALASRQTVGKLLLIRDKER